MKNTYKIFSGLFLFSVLFTSCSSEEQKNELSALEQELSMDHTGTLTVESTTYIFKASGETTKFISNDRAFDFKYTDELNYNASNSASKHEGNDLIITNPATQEFIRLHNFKDLKNNRLQFDVELSNGKQFNSVVYNSPSQLVNDLNKCHDGPCRNVNEHAVRSFLEMSNDDATAACSDAVAACLKAGGKPSVTITGGTSWFTSPESCVTECK